MRARLAVLLIAGSWMPSLVAVGQLTAPTEREPLARGGRQLTAAEMIAKRGAGGNTTYVIGLRGDRQYGMVSYALDARTDLVRVGGRAHVLLRWFEGDKTCSEV